MSTNWRKTLFAYTREEEARIRNAIAVSVAYMDKRCPRKEKADSWIPIRKVLNMPTADASGKIPAMEVRRYMGALGYSVTQKSMEIVVPEDIERKRDAEQMAIDNGFRIRLHKTKTKRNGKAQSTKDTTG